jgi:outer membrane protein OmpA-like peptidoglycan-associated protein
MRAARIACWVLAAGTFAWAGVAFTAPAEQQPSADQIIKALKPPKLTRGLTAPAAEPARAAEDARFVEGLRTRTTRSLSTDERERVAEIAKTRPSIDLEINFEYNSAVISPKAIPQVNALADALSSSDLKGATFMLAGHTDAKGGDTYNQGLSERRADAVRAYLKEKRGIDGSLLTTGYGRTHLKNGSSPYAAENRRVQVINLADK